jgi:hypothetical protein
MSDFAADLFDGIADRQQRSAADRGGEPGARVDDAQPLQVRPAGQQRPGPDPAGHDDDVRRRHLGERRVDGEPEETVRGADLAPSLPTNTGSSDGTRCSTS